MYLSSFITSEFHILAVITGEFRRLGVITGEIRKLAVITGEFRMLPVITGEFRILGVISGEFRMLTVITGEFRILGVISGEFRMLTVITDEIRKLAAITGEIRMFSWYPCVKVQFIRLRQLIRLRLGLFEQDLTYRFGISQPSVSRILRKCLPILATRSHLQLHDQEGKNFEKHSQIASVNLSQNAL